MKDRELGKMMRHVNCKHKRRGDVVVFSGDSRGSRLDLSRYRMRLSQVVCSETMDLAERGQSQGKPGEVLILWTPDLRGE